MSSCSRPPLFFVAMALVVFCVLPTACFADSIAVSPLPPAAKTSTVDCLVYLNASLMAAAPATVVVRIPVKPGWLLDLPGCRDEWCWPSIEWGFLVDRRSKN